MTGILNILAGSIAAAIKDGYFNLVTLLLPGNGTNGSQNNTFLDSSTNNFTITRNGNTTQGTFSPFSQTGWSVYTAGLKNKGSRIDVSNTSGIFGSNTSYTFEGWFYFTATSASDNINLLTANESGGTGARFLFDVAVTTTTITPRIVTEGNAVLFNGNAVSYTLNTWVHIAFVNNVSGNAFTFYINGVAAGNRAQTSVGAYATLNLFCNSIATTADTPLYASNVRITDAAIYTSAFTPSTTPLTTTVSTGTVKLLTFQSNRFLDNSSGALTVNPVLGTHSVQAFSPFAPTAAYSAATNGGSGYFDGTGDYLSGVSGGMPSGQGTAFTLQTWVYVTSLAAARVITRGDSPGRLEIRIDTNGSVSVDNVSTATICATAAGAVRINAWTHIAITRTTGNIYTIYINGVSSATSSAYSTSITANDTIGYSAFSGSNYFVGYMSGFRVTTTLETISVPTAPPTAITGTSLLLNFTNGGITDATGKNVLETVGNAQISTTQSKFGGSSMYFDGTGDTLKLPSSPLARIGDFTAEAWVRTTSTADQTVFYFNGVSNGTSALRLGLSTSGTYLLMSVDGANWAINSGIIGTVNTNTWYHITVVRSGGTIRLYVDGTSIFSSTAIAATTSLMSGTYHYIGAIEFSGFGNVLNGFLDDVRITPYARYSGTSFTAPTAPFALQ